MKSWIGLASVLSVLGCAQSPQQAGGDASAQMVCTREVPIGTTIAINRCRTPEQLARERELARTAASEIRSSTATPGSVPGGK